MNAIERILSTSPWWVNPEWFERDRSIRHAEDSGIRFRHLNPKLRKPENLLQGSVSIIRGPRQVGKTTELKLFVRDLLDAGVKARNIAYYPCDDIIHFRELSILVKVFADAVRMKNQKGYLMLDEISSVKQWPRAIKPLVDAGDLDHIYLLLTGSSAVEVKRGYERMPGRRGKGFDRAFLPMPFADYCKINSIEFPEVHLEEILKNKALFKEYEIELLLKKSEFIRLHEQYLQWGGFPRVVSDLFRQGKVSDETFEIYRAVLFSEFEKQRREVAILLSLMRKLYRVLGTPVSYSGLTRDTGCRSVSVVQSYLAILTASFLGFELPCINLNNREPYPKRGKKFYALDPIIWKITARGAGFAPPALSLLAEQSAAVHLARLMVTDWASLGFLRGLYYYRSKKGNEVDFVHFENQDNLAFGVEVKYQRHVSGWDEQSIIKGIGKGLLVTRDSFKWSEKVCYIPLWAFLLI